VARTRAARHGVTMRAIIYAAGVGSRLGTGADHAPKVLLEFAGRSLLERHIDILTACGVTDIVVVVGYAADRIEAALAGLTTTARTRTVYNPDYRQGSIVTQWSVREALGEGGDVLLMDADVLYDKRLIERLVASPHANCFLLDRAIEAGEEPVKLCVKDGALVDFRKNPSREYDWCGESVGFFKLSEATARRLVDSTRAYIETGRTGEYYDEALRDLLIADPPGSFGFEDITGLPWIEIDFAADIEEARRAVLPKLAGDGA